MPVPRHGDLGGGGLLSSAVLYPFFSFFSFAGKRESNIKNMEKVEVALGTIDRYDKEFGDEDITL